MDKQWPKENDKEASALSCHYVAKQNTVLSRISGACEVNVYTLRLGMLVEANEVHPDGGLTIRVYDTSNEDIWRKTEWRCHKIDLLSVPTLVWHFLAAVPVPQERVRIASDSELCQEAKMLRIGGRIWYQPRQTDAQKCLAVIKYIGTVTELGQGFYFGLELLDSQIHSQTCILANKYITNSSGNLTLATLSEVRPLESELSDKVKNSVSTKTPAVENMSLVTDFDSTLIGSTSNNHITNGKKMQRDLSVGFEGRLSAFDDTNNNNNNGDTFTRLNNPLVPKVARQSTKSKIVSNDVGLLTPKNLSDSELIDYLLEKRGAEHTEHVSVGSAVEFRLGSETRYGVIRWIGTLQGASGVTTAAIELEDGDHPLGTDGTCCGERYFHCRPHRAIFTDIKNCQEFNMISGDDHLHKLNGDDFGMFESSVVTGIVRPISVKGDLESICGKYRGIQGHHNSCYLDATLFSMFAFTSVFDNLLFRPPNEKDCPQYEEVQRVLREEIVNPLRKDLFVRANRVMKLRMLLEKLSSVSGLTSEEKDPEEFLTSLVAQILNAEPFLKLSSGQDAFHYQLFVEKDDHLSFPTVQQLLEQSFLTSNIRLKEVPSCLIIQMPRFGKSFKMYQKIQPTLLLDVTDIIEDLYKQAGKVEPCKASSMRNPEVIFMTEALSKIQNNEEAICKKLRKFDSIVVVAPRQCTVCGKLAEFECKECYEQCGVGLESIAFCMHCLEKVHRHERRTNHVPKKLDIPTEFIILQEHCPVPRLYLELSAVVCIETSHYVSFVKCGSGSEAPWCFFDSMADRKGEQNGYNIPEMVPCPDFPYWLSEEGANSLTELTDDRQLPEHAKRLLCDAYMCMYQSPDVMMYK